ncbi:magnesium chelatase family protein [Marmoricola sp. OAE513]|uniref:YifB family Mg chelatase-like AAA ATPase n=1 Tax=Marmoricola sp. OAE513 TaxID=2817894 RepID=UPI001AE26093
MYAATKTVSLAGAVGHVVDVQVDVTGGLIITSIVGRPDASINEGRTRCRAAIENSGLDWPSSKRVTILLSPTDLPKRGPHFDLAMAVGVVAATKPLPAGALEDLVLIGELSLDGRLRAVPGVLPMVMAAAAAGIGRVVVPEPQIGEASLVPDVEVYGVRSLSQALALLTGEDVPEAPEVAPVTGESLLSWRGQERLEQVDLVDVLGMADARYALEVAAVGGHHLLLTGAKGTGKTTLAERLPTILPDLDTRESLELTAIHSLAGGLPVGATVLRRPPFRAPHHTTSRTGILGGGTGRVHPGEVSKATHGILFLDEFPLLPSDVIEALRQPLESGEITIARGDEDATFPASGMLVLACNPCPCGEWSTRVRENTCLCSEVNRRNYRRKISGPIADRIDITRTIEPVPEHERNDRFSQPESSAVVRARVSAARRRQQDRYGDAGWRLNGHVPGPELRSRWPLAAEATRLLDREVYGGTLTRRGAVRVHRVAWSVADLRGVEVPGPDELEIALRLRTGVDLDLSMLARVQP